MPGEETYVHNSIATLSRSAHSRGVAGALLNRSSSEFGRLLCAQNSILARASLSGGRQCSASTLPCMDAHIPCMGVGEETYVHNSIATSSHSAYSRGVAGALLNRSSSESGRLLCAQNSIPARASLSVGGNARPSHPMHGCGRGDVCSQQYCNIVALCLLSWSSRRSAQPILLGVRKASLRSEQYSSESLSDSGRQCSASTFHI